MITKRDVLISLGFTLIFTVSMTLVHSLAVLFYALAVWNVAVGVYWSLLAHMYKKKRLLAPQHRLEKEDELSGGWLAGWVPIGCAIFCFVWGVSEQWNPNSIDPPIFGSATFCGVGGFIAGFGYSILVWWFWRKYVTAVNRLAQT